MRIVKLSSQSVAFPSPETALHDPNGLLAIGGDLTPARLLAAYERGIFPWYSPGEAILWWSPDPRAVLFPAQFHVSRSLKRFLRNPPFRITLNHDFAAVIAACSYRPDEGTWIGEEVQQAYLQLHHLGHAHSIEVWQGEELVGGLYGVAQGRCSAVNQCLAALPTHQSVLYGRFAAILPVMEENWLTVRCLTLTLPGLEREKFPAANFCSS
ncbi:Leucyl/phenylalanyl-tRNA--protein transferase [Serratia fonticola]|uniref:Leucyl/phenylalanyl-tRNA--protein transferase n=1 Tax=Serratia fonticola TaxID=47917 RepID=A0A3S4WZC8_SERFO|nr:Leucyl/phenylalanyl-tRNA--protein transferase [Serratia fonticola]